MLKLPSAPVAAKKGCGSTPAQACIQPCTLHSNGNMTSTVVKERFVVMVVGWLMLNGRFFFPIALILWRIPSLFLIARPWPTMIPNTRGWYMHAFWSISTGVVGVGYLASAGSPAFTYTNTLASVPFLFTSTTDSCGVVVYFALHLGSSVISIAGLAGAFPTNLTLPVTVAPATALRGAGAGRKASTRSPAPTAATEPSLRIVPPHGVLKTAFAGPAPRPTSPAPTSPALQSREK